MPVHVWLPLALIALPALALCARFFRRRRMEKQLKLRWCADAEPLERDILEDAAGYHRMRRAAMPDTALVDDATWDDLDMDVLFLRLNRTMSAAGREVLYDILRDTGASAEALKARDVRAQAFGRDENLRLRVQMALTRVLKPSFHGAPRYLFRAGFQVPERRGIYYALSLSMVLLIAASPFFPQALLAMMGLLIVNIAVYAATERRWGREKCALKHIASVLSAARQLSKIDAPELAADIARIKARVHELRAVRFWLPMFAMERAGDLDFLTNYLKIMFLLDMVSLCAIARGTQRHEQALRDLYQLVGELDAALAITQLREVTPVHCVPEFTSDLRVQGKGLAHPLIVEPVRNDVDWQGCALLTGSNASGKSTFVKAMAINCILAQTIYSCFAERFQLPRARVMSSMAVCDSVVDGESYFVAEIKRIKRLLDAATEGGMLLAFVDEILRGTNTVERVAASSAVLRALADHNLLCMAATHDIELTRMLADVYENWHFREEVTERGIVFTYQLHHGSSTTRNALKLLEQMGFAGDIVREAKESAATFEREGRWPMPASGFLS
ncbi:hypothetical protein ACH6CV_14060 [Bacillota bacterium Meth-B3]